MKLRSARFLASLMMLAILFSSSSFVFAFDEGMFPPDQIAKINLKKASIKLKASDIYNPNGGALMNAVGALSFPAGGCTAELVSSDGLILTNHHCSFDGLVLASTVEKDLVETGFNAGSRAGEIPGKGYSMRRMATELKKLKVATPRGGEWHPQTVKMVMQRLAA